MGFVILYRRFDPAEVTTRFDVMNNSAPHYRVVTLAEWPPKLWWSMTACEVRNGVPVFPTRQLAQDYFDECIQYQSSDGKLHPSVWCFDAAEFTEHELARICANPEGLWFNPNHPAYRARMAAIKDDPALGYLI